METAQGEELYVAHNGEQMDFETAIQRCPFLSSFGETALQEIRDELAAYRVLQEQEVTAAAEPKTAEAATDSKLQPVHLHTKSQDLAKPFERLEATPKVPPERGTPANSPPEAVIRNAAVEPAERQLPAANDLAASLLLEELHRSAAPTPVPQMAARAAASKEHPEPDRAEIPESPLVLLEPEQAAPLALEFAEADQVLAAGPTLEPAAESTPEPSIGIQPDLDITQAPADESLPASTPTEAPGLVTEIIPETGVAAALAATAPEVEASATDEPWPAAELEATVIMQLENVDPEQAAAATETIGQVRALIAELEANIPEPAAELPEQVQLKLQAADEVIAEQPLPEAYVQRLKALAAQILEQLEIPSEPIAVRHMLQLLLPPELYEQLLQLQRETYDRGTHERKLTDAATTVGKYIPFAGTKETAFVLLGKWVLAQLTRLQPLASTAA